MPLPVTLDRTSSEPLYRQVARQVREAIDAHRLLPGERVPSVRELAGSLDVGRLTVATAYEQLAADGYLVGRVGFGTVVAADPPTTDQGPGAATAAGPPAPRPGIRASTAAETRVDLRPGSVSGNGLAAGQTLERCYRDAWRELGATSSTAAHGGALRLLRAAIAVHVRTSRGLRCDPEQVVILSGALTGLAALTQRLTSETGPIAVEDPPEPTFRRALQLAGARLAPVATDRDGLRLDALPAEAAVAIAAPRVQPLTGARMPLARRVGLLAWAARAGAMVLEDARLDDLSLDAGGGTALAGLDDGGRVVHLGGFVALLHPGVQLAYAVVPTERLAAFEAAVSTLDPGATPVQVRALGRYLADGHLDRHLVRVRRAIGDRLEATTAAIRRELGWLVSATAPAGGSRLVVTIEDEDLTATRAAAAAERHGIALEPLSSGRIRHTGIDRELVLDVGRHEARELTGAIAALGRVLAEERRRAGQERAHHRPATRQIAPIPRRWPAVTRAAPSTHRETPRVAVSRAAREG